MDLRFRSAQFGRARLDFDLAAASDTTASRSQFLGSLRNVGAIGSSCRLRFFPKLVQVRARGLQKLDIVGVPDRLLGRAFSKVREISNQLPESDGRSVLTELGQRRQQVLSYLSD